MGRVVIIIGITIIGQIIGKSSTLPVTLAVNCINDCDGGCWRLGSGVGSVGGINQQFLSLLSFCGCWLHWCWHHHGKVVFVIVGNAGNGLWQWWWVTESGGSSIRLVCCANPWFLGLLCFLSHQHHHQVHHHQHYHRKIIFDVFGSISSGLWHGC